MSLSVSNVSQSYSHESGVSEAFNLKLNEAIASYREFRRFNITALSEAKVIFLGEDHKDQQCCAMKAAVMNFFASQGPVILLQEGVPSGEILIDEKENHFRTNFIRLYCDSAANEENFHIVGWDSSEDLIRLLIAKISNPSYEVVQNAQKNLSEEIRRLLSLKEQCKQLAAIEDNSAEGVECQIQAWASLKRDIEESSHKIKQLNAQFHQVADEYSLNHKALQETNPIRNEALKSTLQHLDEIKDRLQLSKDVLVIVIAGSMHLKNEEEDLSPLYDELEKNHKAVILVPSHIYD